MKQVVSKEACEGAAVYKTALLSLPLPLSLILLFLQHQFDKFSVLFLPVRCNCSKKTVKPFKLHFDHRKLQDRAKSSAKTARHQRRAHDSSLFFLQNSKTF